MASLNYESIFLTILGLRWVGRVAPLPQTVKKKPLYYYNIPEIDIFMVTSFYK